LLPDKPTVFEFVRKYNYKDIVFTQQATGVWSAKVLSMIDTQTL